MQITTLFPGSNISYLYSWDNEHNAAQVVALAIVILSFSHKNSHFLLSILIPGQRENENLLASR